MVEGLAKVAPWPQRVQAPGKSFHGFGNSPAPPVKKLLLALGEKKLGPPSPLVAVLAQGFMIFREAGDQNFHCLEFGLDSADTREERGLRLGLGRCRCVRHGWMIARKGYRSPKFAYRAGPWISGLTTVAECVKEKTVRSVRLPARRSEILDVAEGLLVLQERIELSTSPLPRGFLQGEPTCCGLCRLDILLMSSHFGLDSH